MQIEDRPTYSEHGNGSIAACSNAGSSRSATTTQACADALVLVFALALTCVLGAGAARAEAAAPDAPRPTMGRVFEEMKTLIPLSLDQERWAAPAQRAEILASLERLERAAGALGEHARGREIGFETLSINLSNDLREVLDHYRAGEFDTARFFLTGSLQTCVACHVRLPSAVRFPLADQLLDQVEELDPREKAWLFVTVRRFDSALETWEGLLKDPNQPPSQLDASGVLVDYLNLVLRTQADAPRAKKTLKKFAKRKDQPLYLKKRLANWIAALEKLEREKFSLSQPASLERGTEWAKEAGRLAEGPFDRDGLVQDLAAASHLVRWLEADRAQTLATTRSRTPKEKRQTAQAYYWLGVVEARSLDGFWVNLSERHLEAAIRSDPKGPHAENAYARLEEIQVLGFGGSSGNHLPADVWSNLRDLRVLMGIE
jgi:hypothetical protein